ncbi:MAG: pantetheine-phosphate adenylyltransferase [Christensenellales bacterium]
MKTAAFPGSFDPVTLGHIDLMKRALRLCDRLLVAILVNPEKQGTFPLDRRIAMIRDALGPAQDIQVLSYGGLLVDFVREQGVDFIVRGVRGVQDLENETAMAFTNARLLPGLQTVFLPASPEYVTLSSSLVRQIAAFQGDLSPFLPETAVDEVRSRLYNKR